ncbi:AMP-binding protein [Virgibacillus sp. 179-BFC.A HS]|uniref:AMP-binding protein n=1 Tax=Tigheibacillus jepli TaxID=3035914 RepID=A0ABU5CNR0_9BACI|nr:AMP-binding protein [Virgibacillus sp. 179-BFC.A HS]MDY0407093.1 AMP-binding protein [Virgibacillus sp. 179-BFC.A HS]
MKLLSKHLVKSAYAYVNKPEESEKVFYKGWIYIGDMATWDENEYITIVGRKDDMIVSSGENIHPVQVEEVLNTHPKVSESVVVGVPDKLRGESVVAYIVKSDDSLTADELHKFCLENPMLADYKCPRFYQFIDELPYTATGKKKHYLMKEQAKRDQEKGLLKR